MNSETGTRQGVEAVEVVGAILHALLGLPRPARLKDLEDSTGVPSAKLHRYLVSMTRCGLVRRDGGARYDFGLLAYRMGQVASHDHELLSLLEPLFRQYASQLVSPELGQAIGIGQWVGEGATIVRWFESDAPLSIRMKPGALLDITGSATAKLLAAYLPRATTEALVRKELASKGKGAEKDVRRVYEDYAAIREQEMAASVGARFNGVNALSVPLFNPDGEVLAAITLLGMAPHFDASPQGRAAVFLRRVSREMSARLGAPRARAR
jgi:DNA-binding IclR family transcriptional regulator